MPSSDRVAVTKDLYSTLCITVDASSEQIRKAYRKLAMQYHPDKNLGDEEASARFQAISEAYAILSDPEKRRFYDDTGELDDIECRPEEFKEQFQEMMAELMGDDDGIMDMVRSMSPAEIAAMPPFPFPRELFPEGTFPPGMRFSSDGLADLPPSMQRAMEEGDLASVLHGGACHGGSSRSWNGGGRHPKAPRRATARSTRTKMGGVKVGRSSATKRRPWSGMQSVYGGSEDELADMLDSMAGFGSDDDDDELLMMMMQEVADGKIPAGMPRDVVEDILAEAKAMGLPLQDQQRNLRGRRGATKLNAAAGGLDETLSSSNEVKDTDTPAVTKQELAGTDALNSASQRYQPQARANASSITHGGLDSKGGEDDVHEGTSLRLNTELDNQNNKEDEKRRKAALQKKKKRARQQARKAETRRVDVESCATGEGISVPSLTPPQQLAEHADNAPLRGKCPASTSFQYDDSGSSAASADGDVVEGKEWLEAAKSGSLTPFVLHALL